MTNEFSGTRVLITAGASGIGAATAKQFLDCGAHVHICDIDEAAVSRFLKENPTATGSITDVSNEQSVDELFETVQQDSPHRLLSGQGVEFRLRCESVTSLQNRE